MKKLVVSLFVLFSLSVSAQQYQASENCVRSGCYTDSKMNEVAKELVEIWERSPGHRANMLGNHTKFGFGLSLRFRNTMNNSGSISVYKVFAVQTFN